MLWLSSEGVGQPAFDLHASASGQRLGTVRNRVAGLLQRHFADRDRSAAGPVRATVQMEVVAVRGVVVRPEHGGKALAGAIAHLA